MCVWGGDIIHGSLLVISLWKMAAALWSEYRLFISQNYVRPLRRCTKSKWKSLICCIDSHGSAPPVHTWRLPISDTLSPATWPIVLHIQVSLVYERWLWCVIFSQWEAGLLEGINVLCKRHFKKIKTWPHLILQPQYYLSVWFALFGYVWVSPYRCYE